MDYVLSGIGAWNDAAPAERRAESALEALRAATAYLREEHRAPIADGAGQLVSLPELLAEANREASDPNARQQLTAALADYVEVTRERELERAKELYAVLTSLQYEHELLFIESQGDSTAEQRRRDADEREQLRGIMFDERAWHQAGVDWARDFAQPPPQELIEELARRHPRARCDDLRRGAEEQLSQMDGGRPRYQALPTADGWWGVWNNLGGYFQHLHVYEGIAQAHADALNVGRPWTDKDYGRELRVATELTLRRSQRAARPLGASSPPPPLAPGRRPGSGRRL